MNLSRPGASVVPALALILCLALSPAQPCLSENTSFPASSDTETAILDMMQHMSDGVANRDLDAIMNLFLPGPDVLLVGSKRGKIARGSDEIRALFTGIVNAEAQTRLEWKTHTIHSLGDVAWVFALADLIHESEDSASRAPYRVTALFVRRDGRWYWMQYHGSEPIDN